MSQAIAPLYLVGPTAVGKSAVALDLAQMLGGEIVSVDSMQVYRGMDIGTAKPSPSDRRRVPHHLLDILDVSASFDAAQFVRLAGEARREIEARGRIPIFCGGTGLYFKALLDGLGTAPPRDEALRALLEATPLSDLLLELEKSDPVTFLKIDQKNPRRVVRAIEVIRQTGRPFSEQRSGWEARPNPSDSLIIGLSMDSAALRTRIDRRVDQMFAEGLVGETRELLARGLASNPTAMQAIGYRQVVAHLRGEIPLPEAAELVKIRTRQFAKRQLTWFKRQLPVTWIPVDPSQPSLAVADRVLSIYLASIQKPSGADTAPAAPKH